MKLFPPEIEVGEDEGFEPSKDIFKRKEYGEYLARLFSVVEDPMVVVLDEPWGSGKTTFVKMLAGHLRNESFPVIYYDAFANDYNDDAFISITGEVMSLADKLKTELDSRKERFLDAATSLAKKVLPILGKAAVKAATCNIITDKNFEDVSKAMSDSFANLAETELRSFIAQYGKNKELVSEFKNSLTSLAMMLRESKASEKPLVFIIDELDRCKPPFALSLLERIKHFYSIKGIHFLLVADMRQLENSVMYSYGSSIDSKRYLQKFYNLVERFPSKDERRQSDVRTFLTNVYEGLPDDSQDGEYKNQIIETLEAISLQKGFTLRTVEKISSHVALLLLKTNHNTLRISTIMTCLCALKVEQPSLYERAQKKLISFEELDDYFKFNLWRTDEHSIKFAVDWWKFCVLPSLEGDNEELNDFSKHLHRYGIRNRKDIIPVLCRLLDGTKFVSDK
ncbi:KAP family P-loop NTPase fold protein [Desulfocurvibacter africanus]|uniref:KAP family P-loop NTPase fold protein n=1 Tax=Desulfocurvibacter africanus TaxID=873 RepID=UPI00040E9797|nr:P-loop NTPase fold protein [Desulfocurvibacter africanus]